MKKLMFVIGLGLMSGSVYAACVGGNALCFDDTTVTVNGYSLTANGFDVPALSSTSIALVTPGRVGRVVVCTTCANNPSTFALCLSTSSNIGSFVIAGSTNGIVVCK